MISFLFWLMLAGLAAMTICAIATHVLNEMQWHELEEYCRQKKMPDLFGKIFEDRDRFTLGAGILQMVFAAVAVCSMSMWFYHSTNIEKVPLISLLSFMGLAAFSLVFLGSWVPWAVARSLAVPFMFRTWKWWWMVSLIAWPLMVGGEFVSRLFARASGTDEDEDDEEEAFEDEILSMVSEGQHDGYLESDTRDMIEGVMELDDNNVASVMTHRSQVDAMEETTNWDKMMSLVVKSGRTRIPIFRGKIDNVVGILYAKDLLRESLKGERKRKPLQKLLRPPMKVPASTLLDEMLSKFLHVRTHIAIVQDEYGGMAGVVTIEDILEEIVGEIVDETDKDQSEEITILNPTQADVFGWVPVDHVNEKLGVELPEGDQFDTISGLIMSQLNEIPRSGHELVVGNVQFNIQEANRRQIKSVRLTILDESETG
ncbi:MAG: hemolysin family protein [Planctomycetota bacterium]